jgi:hypothetical protein
VDVSQKFCTSALQQQLNQIQSFIWYRSKLFVVVCILSEPYINSFTEKCSYPTITGYK